MNPSPRTNPNLTAIAFLGGAPAIDYGALGALFRALFRTRRAGQRTIGAPVARKRILSALVLLVAGVLLPATAARAAAMTVPGGLVHISADGQCSLREAIDNANDDDQTHADCPAGSGADVITLGAGTYELSSGRVVEEDSAFLITSDITIIGAGSSSRDGGGATLLDAVEAFRHFEVDQDASLYLQAMQLSNGLTTAKSTEGDHGGAVLNRGTLAATDVRFTHNTATEAGGAVYSFGMVTLTDSVLSHNEAPRAAAVGKATWFEPLSVTGTVIDHNTAAGEWGAAVENIGGTAWIDSSTVGPNTGTGLLNHAHGEQTVMTITNSTVRGNSGGTVGGIRNHAWYFCFIDCVSAPASITVRDSTISGNTASAPDGTGGIRASESDQDGSLGSELTLTNVTIADNASAGAQLRAPRVTGYNVVVADPLNGPNCDETNDGDDWAVWSGGHNVSDDFSCSTGGFAHIPDALLGPLASNGGPTATHLPHPASLLVDAGNQAACDSGVRTGTTPTDQRGMPRTVGAACDIGAVEVDVLGALGIMTHDVAALPLRSGPPARNDGLRASLLAKLTAAEEAVDRGDYDAATGQLGAFNGQVEAYAGGPIMEADAARLTTGALVVTDLFAEGASPPDDGSPPENSR